MEYKAEFGENIELYSDKDGNHCLIIFFLVFFLLFNDQVQQSF